MGHLQLPRCLSARHRAISAPGAEPEPMPLTWVIPARAGAGYAAG